MNRKVIIFDLDGVLFDSTEIVSDFLMTSFPTMTKEILDDMLRGNFHEEFEKVKKVHKKISETTEEFKARSVDYSKRKSTVPVHSGMTDLLKSLHNDGYILVVNTSAYEKNCKPLLEYSGILKYFDLVATKEVSNSKVEKFKIILEKYAVTSDATVFITDTLGDVREADVAQVPTIAVTWGAHDRKYFTEEVHRNIIAIVDSVAELEKTLRNSI